MSNAALERAAALASLATGQPVASGGEAAPRLERTGNTVDAGGDELRLLVIDAPSLGRVVAGVYHRTPAVAGDLVKLTKAQAERFDSLGATVDPDTDTEELAELDAEGKVTDEQIRTMGAPDLVAYVGQHPDERERVRAIEEERPANKRRSTILTATEPTPDEDEDAKAAAEAAEAERMAAEQAAAEAETKAAAEAQQANDGGATGE